MIVEGGGESASVGGVEPLFNNVDCMLLFDYRRALAASKRDLASKDVAFVPPFSNRAPPLLLVTLASHGFVSRTLAQGHAVV
mgnify:CR=1 FL=1